MSRTFTTICDSSPLSSNIGVPVAICLGVSSAAYLLFHADIPLVVFSQKIYAGVDSFVLLCIPGFIMAGNLMNGGGITDRIIRFASAGVGWIRGGLGLTNVAASMVFAGISGTAVAEAASIGAVMVMGASATEMQQVLVGVFSLLAASFGMFVLLRMADGVVRALHRTGIAVLSKLTGLLLAAIAAQVIFTGIRAFLG